MLRLHRCTWRLAIAMCLIAPQTLCAQAVSVDQIRNATRAVRADLGSADSQRSRRWDDHLALQKFESSLASADFSLDDAQAMVGRLQTVQLFPSQVRLDRLIRAAHRQLNSTGDADTENDDADFDEELGKLRAHIRTLGPRGAGWMELLALDVLASNLREVQSAAEETLQIAPETDGPIIIVDPSAGGEEDGEDDPSEAVEDARSNVLSSLAHLEQELTKLKTLSDGGRTQLRQALNDWQTRSESPMTDALALEVRNAKYRYQPVRYDRLEASRTKLMQSMQRLDTFLGQGKQSNAERWKKFLSWKTLRSQLGTGDPRIRELAKSYGRFRSGENGLMLPVFSNVREDLRSYLEQLQLADGDPRRLPNARRELVSAVEGLQRYLQTASQQREENWKKFLQWELLQELLDEDSRDVRRLNRVLVRFEADEIGLELAPFRRVANRLGKYMELLVTNRGGVSDVDRVATRLETIAQHLQNHADSPSALTAADLVGDLQWLDATGQMPGLAQRIRSRFAQPNVQFTIQSDLVARALSDGASQSDPVGMCFYGSWVSGITNSQVNYRGQLVPTATSAVIDIVVGGAARTVSTATKRKVNVHTTADTSLSATKRLVFDGFTLTSTPTVANACTSQRVCSVCVNRRIGRRLISRLARRRAAKLKPCAEQLANCQGRDKLAKQMDEQSEEMLSKANAQLAELRNQLKEQNLFPEQLFVQSTNQAILMRALLSSSGEFTASDPAPALASDSDIVVQLHESAINNLIANRIAGMKIDSDGMAEQMKALNIEMPEPKKSDKKSNGDAEDEDEDEEPVDDEPWSMQFDQVAPASVGFRDGKIIISIRGQKFTKGAQEINNKIDISASYEFVFTPGRGLGVRRDGDVDISFVGVDGRLTTRQLAYKTFLARKVEPLFRERISMEDIPAGELKDQLDKLPPKAIYARRGWITVGTDIEDSMLKEAMGS